MGWGIRNANMSEYLYDRLKSTLQICLNICMTNSRAHCKLPFFILYSSFFIFEFFILHYHLFFFFTMES